VAPAAVVLDLGGVVMLEPTDELFAALRGHVGLDADAFEAAWAAPRHAYDRGDLTAAEYWRLVGFDGGARLEDVLDADAACWSTPNLPLAEWIPRLRAAGVRTGVLSNMPREQWDRLGPAYARWLDGCDELTLSFEVGSAKPEERIYRHCLERLGTPPAETLFVDDRPENVEAALALGLDAILYTGLDSLRGELSGRFDGTLPLPGAVVERSA
jgi:putative hydrolase of the HAD superfamily